jgi:hypothetical protein
MHKSSIIPACTVRSLLFLAFAVTFIPGCKNKNYVRIEGTVKNNTSDHIFISKIDIDKPVLLDSSEITNKNRFRFKIKAEEPDFYQVSFSGTNYITLLAEPGEKVELTFTNDYLYDGYTVTGSKGSALIQILDARLLRTKTRLDSITSIYNQAQKEPDFETRGRELEQEYTKLIKEQRRFNIEFIINNMSSLASIKALYQKFNDQAYVLYDMRDLQYLKIVADSLKRHYPDSKHTKALVRDFEKEMNQFRARQLEQLTNNAPVSKLDPALKDINGKRIALSSLKGKYVLLAFWSAESKECISENLQLKEYYRLYRNKGFEIYQISLDTDETIWKTAVRFDDLPWISTREDDPANPQNAILFNVKALPANYLFDPKGEIIASNLHGRNLQIKLNQLFLY